MTPLERRCRWLLCAYPAWYRRQRSGEMLGTLLEASPPGRRWPSLRDARALVTGGVRVRGRVWWLSMLWVVLGAGGAGYSFFVTTKPFTNAGFWIPAWNTEPLVAGLAAALAGVAWLVLPLPVLVAGFVRLRGWRPGGWLRTAVWAGAWGAGLALMRQAAVWGEYPARAMTQTCRKSVCADHGPAVVSWGELPICAAWLVLAAVMTLTLARPAHGSEVPEACPMRQ